MDSDNFSEVLESTRVNIVSEIIISIIFHHSIENPLEILEYLLRAVLNGQAHLKILGVYDCDDGDDDDDSDDGEEVEEVESLLASLDSDLLAGGLLKLEEFHLDAFPFVLLCSPLLCFSF